jgi:hypothetical protein
MPTTYYYTVDSEIIGEHTAGQSRIDYLTDALGSVVTTVDQSQTVTSTARYKPFGDDLAVTGTRPVFGWNGMSGYRRTGRPHAQEYIRNRTLSTTGGRWTTVDSLSPSEPAYEYCHSSAVTFVDWSGMAVQAKDCPGYKCEGGRVVPDPTPNFGIADAVKTYCSTLTSCKSQPTCWSKLQNCIRKCNYDRPTSMANCLLNMCQSSGSTNATVKCGGDSCNGDVAYASNANSSNCQIYICPHRKQIRCGCSGVSPDFWEVDTFSLTRTIGHELAHCCGVGNDTGYFNKYNSLIANCISNCVVDSKRSR